MVAAGCGSPCPSPGGGAWRRPGGGGKCSDGHAGTVFGSLLVRHRTPDRCLDVGQGQPPLVLWGRGGCPEGLEESGEGGTPWGRGAATLMVLSHRERQCPCLPGVAGARGGSGRRERREGSGGGGAVSASRLCPGAQAGLTRPPSPLPPPPPRPFHRRRRGTCSLLQKGGAQTCRQPRRPSLPGCTGSAPALGRGLVALRLPGRCHPARCPLPAPLRWAWPWAHLGVQRSSAAHMGHGPPAPPRPFEGEEGVSRPLAGLPRANRALPGLPLLPPVRLPPHNGRSVCLQLPLQELQLHGQALYPFWSLLLSPLPRRVCFPAG